MVVAREKSIEPTPEILDVGSRAWSILMRVCMYD